MYIQIFQKYLTGVCGVSEWESGHLKDCRSVKSDSNILLYQEDISIKTISSISSKAA
jgi:hypothetical protein